MTDRYGLAAIFTQPTALVAASRQAKAAGYTQVEAYTPFAIPELADALGHARSAIPTIMLVAGLASGLITFAGQCYALGLAYPFNVGGRPLISWPAYLPLTFELTVLGAALAGVVALLVLNQLPAPYHPIFGAAEFDRASTDRFFLCIAAADPRFDPEATKAFLASLRPEAIAEVPW